jgi:hypothetical protein
MGMPGPRENGRVRRTRSPRHRMPGGFRACRVRADRQRVGSWPGGGVGGGGLHTCGEFSGVDEEAGRLCGGDAPPTGSHTGVTVLAIPGANRHHSPGGTSTNEPNPTKGTGEKQVAGPPAYGACAAGLLRKLDGSLEKRRIMLFFFDEGHASFAQDHATPPCPLPVGGERSSHDPVS